jgi:hypothetical protein
MPVDNPDTQIQVNENPSPEVVSRGLNTLMVQPYIMIKVRVLTHSTHLFSCNRTHDIYALVIA